MYILNVKYQNEAIRTILIITFHLAQILELQHLDVSTVVQLDHALLQTEHNIIVLQKVPSEDDPKVRNHGEGPY